MINAVKGVYRALSHIKYIVISTIKEQRQISHYDGLGYHRDIVCPHCKDVDKYDRMKYEERCRSCNKEFTVIGFHGLTAYRKQGDTTVLRRDGMNVECMTEEEIHKLNEVKEVIKDE